MNFNQCLLATFVSSALLVSVADATESLPTQKVVGRKPVIKFTGNKPATVQLGDVVTLSDSDFTFTDIDGDIEDARTYIWRLNGVDTGVRGLRYDILRTATVDLGKVLTLAIVPKTTTGDPTKGDEVVVDFGAIVVNPTAAPIISALAMSGTLQLGQKLAATYTFNANGGNLTDKSTFKWGRLGSTASTVSAGSSVSASQLVDGYQLTVADVGQVVELSVKAKNGLGVVGNTITVTSASLSGGGSGGQVVNPADFAVRVNYTSSATEALNGPGYAGRPVVAKDLMTAQCKFTGAPDSDFKVCDVSTGAPYTLKWKGTTNGGSTYTTLSAGVTGATYLPNTAHQGQQIVAELTAK
jgi:hypothetical protein